MHELPQVVWREGENLRERWGRGGEGKRGARRSPACSAVSEGLQRHRRGRGQAGSLVGSCSTTPIQSCAEKAEPPPGPAPAPVEALGVPTEALPSATEVEGGSPGPEGESGWAERTRASTWGCPRAGLRGFCSQGQVQQPPVALVPSMTPSASL